MTSRLKIFLLGIGIFLSAILPRYVLTHTARFGEDEAIFWNAARQIYNGESQPVLGPPISGGQARIPGSAFYYLMSISQWVSSTPESANIFTVVLNSLAVVLFWFALRTAFGGVPALVTTLMFSFSPWNLLASDRIWPGNAVNVVVIIAFWSAMKVRENSNSKWVGMLVFSAGIIPQFHLTAPIVWVSLLTLIYTKRSEINRRYVFIGILVLCFAYAPYCLSELRTGYSNLGAYLAESHRTEFNSNFLRVPLYGFRFLTLDISFHELMGYWFPYREWEAVKVLLFGTRAHPFFWFRLFCVLTSFVLASTAIRVFFKRQATENDEVVAFRKCILFGLLSNLILLGVAKKGYYAHYTLPLIPFLFLVYAVLFERLLKNPKKLKLAFLGSLLFMVGGVESALSVSRQIDSVNSLAFERQVIEKILFDLKDYKEKSVGLKFDFPGVSLFAYETLARHAYGSNLRFVTESNGPSYLISVSESGSPLIKTSSKIYKGY